MKTKTCSKLTERVCGVSGSPPSPGSLLLRNNTWKEAEEERTDFKLRASTHTLLHDRLETNFLVCVDTDLISHTVHVSHAFKTQQRPFLTFEINFTLCKCPGSAACASAEGGG